MSKKEKCIKKYPDKSKEYRINQKKRGLKLFRVWVPEEYAADVSDLTRNFIEEMEEKLNDR